LKILGGIIRLCGCLADVYEHVRRALGDFGFINDSAPSGLHTLFKTSKLGDRSLMTSFRFMCGEKKLAMRNLNRVVRGALVGWSNGWEVDGPMRMGSLRRL